MDPSDEHAVAIRRVSLAIALTIVASILLGSWIGHRVGRRWTDAVHLLKDLERSLTRVRTDMRYRAQDASDVGQVATILMDAVQQQRERRRAQGPPSP